MLQLMSFYTGIKNYPVNMEDILSAQERAQIYRAREAKTKADYYTPEAVERRKKSAAATDELVRRIRRGR